ncbi:MAG: GNAT family N-acetyltransferase [Desulfobacula sp.]|jgi:GNAT superfamily N-acetyltransferase|uniref:GNAT family N-acetyltransferase n=1 Tax=Desulfobacula sp. TaxID=2593537 RepID=UPI001D905E2E|nr:GNAT family N-acetyltransferase [Desulfobacula sp.]MBT3485520.1 GNAT family N-acetyltransferase [Desulfobacula sp.]MBT3805337.1 GNAT family N-acetyltransferase [Desulfobacula sp.]MBT4025689.1 GNAT family N-acetyltransferase [Desulfobacula sp.]MBT4197498.1 GNAT family N-acetyltransferase [Desulfobacula sp.]
MEVREIRKNELDQLLEFYLLHLYDVKDDPLADKKVVDQIWNTIQTSENFAVLGVFDKNILMASCSITIVPNLTRGCRSYALIENIATHRKHRREGYGKTILLYAADYAKERNCYKAMFMTGHLNTKVEQFCQATGFSGEDKKAYIKRWEY